MPGPASTQLAIFCAWPPGSPGACSPRRSPSPRRS
jgi:hypothetical protein